MTDHPWFKHYDPGVPRTIERYPEGTLLDAIDEALRERPDAPAFLFKRRAMSWRELADSSDAFAVALVAMGVSRGDRVACFLPNCPQFFIAELATWKLGAIFVPFNPAYTEDELAEPLETTGASVVVTLSMFYAGAKNLQQRVPGIRHVVLTNIKEWFPPLLRAMFTLFVERKSGHHATSRDGDSWMPDLIARHAGQRPAAARPGPDDDALLLLSGGTTGTPKAVRIHHGALVQTGTQVNAWLGDVLPKWEGVYCLPLPMFHSYGACGVQSVCFLGHNAMALVPNPRDFDDLVKTIETTKPAVFCGVPSLYTALLNHKRVQAGKVDFRSMKACVSGAAPMMAETMKRFEEATGARIVEGYALTESALAATVSPLRGPRKPGSVGTPLPDVEVRIVNADDATQEMPLGEVGEILLTGPQIMRGYWGSDAQQMKEILRRDASGRSWLHTADLGYLDADGYLYIVDRKKDLIKMRGMQVWPREIEEAIAAHPAVQEVGVRGYPDAAQGEVAVAFVVRRRGQAVTEHELREWCKQRIAPFKVPARVVFKHELPKSMVGKILRRLLTPVALLTVIACGAGGRPSDPAPTASSAQRVLLISLDGYRWDYINRAPAVRLRELAARGVRAERMIPIFPSKTFPNHYAIVTGLFAEEHGIVANSMRDKDLGLFGIRDTLAQSESRWWGGEPIWVTAERQGRRAASTSWPGSEAVIKGYAASWWTRYWHNEPHESRVRKMLDWLALPPDSAPALIVGYFHDVDSRGHANGPEATETDSAIARVDRSVGAIMDGIAALGLTEVVNIILVADHGMAETHINRTIVLDDLIDLTEIDVIDWTPVAAIAPRVGDEERVFTALHGKHPNLQVYRKGSVPAQWRFNAHPRITEIVAVADEGWHIASRVQYERWRAQGRAVGGTHGYPPELISMGALFLAAGPGIARGKIVPPFQNVHIYPLMAHLLGLKPAPVSGSLDSVRAVLR